MSTGPLSSDPFVRASLAQLRELMSQLKELAIFDREQCLHVLVSNPQLTKSAFQAQCTLGMSDIYNEAAAEYLARANNFELADRVLNNALVRIPHSPPPIIPGGSHENTRSMLPPTVGEDSDPDSHLDHLPSPAPLRKRRYYRNSFRLTN